MAYWETLPGPAWLRWLVAIGHVAFAIALVLALWRDWRRRKRAQCQHTRTTVTERPGQKSERCADCHHLVRQWYV